MTNQANGPTTQQEKNDTLAVIVPTYFRNPRAPGLSAGLNRFFTQFASQREDNFTIFLSDSGPAENKDIIGDLMAACLDEHSWLKERVHYHYEVTPGPPLSRAAAMNLGVAMTQGDYLLFLHVDCQLPTGGLALLRQTFESGAKGGGFLKKYVDMPGPSPLLLTEQYLNWLRTRVGRHLVGTNGIFLHRDIAKEHPYHGTFLEDVELSDWLRKRLSAEEWQLVEASMGVSTRKYYKQGVWPSLAINFSVMTLYRVFGLPPGPLKDQLYHRKFPEGRGFWREWSQATTALFRARHNLAQTQEEERT